MKFRDNLKEMLVFRGLQVKELAALSGVKKRTLDNYLRESGAEPSAENAVKIAKVLDVTVEYLITGKNTPDVAPEPVSREVLLIARQAARLSREQGEVILALMKVFRAGNS